MFNFNKIICLCLFVYGMVNCDGNGWAIVEEVQIGSETASDESKASSTITAEESKPSDSVNSTEMSNSGTQQQTTESVNISTEKPLLKEYGCATRLWTGGKKFCWAKCDSASTSNIWNTWCFTTNSSTVESEQAKYIECESDELCRPEWKCKSSCGLVSPHWDRDSANLEEAITPSDSTNA